MRKLVPILALLAFFTVTMSPFVVDAAGKKAKSEVVMKMGSKVHLFHSSKVEVQKDIDIGEVLTVYRQMGGKTPQPKEVGEVKVLSFIGPHYFEAEVVKGKIKVGDVATKNDTSLLVQPAK